MHKKTYLRFIFLSLVMALVLGSASLLLLNRLTSMSSAKERDRFLGYLAESIESRLRPLPGTSGLRDPFGDDDFLLPPPPLRPGHGGPGFFPPPPFMGERPPPPPDGRRGPPLWLVNEGGEVLFQNRKIPLPLSWKNTPLPQEPHEVVEVSDFFRLDPGVQILLLNTSETASQKLYLVAAARPRPPLMFLFGTQAVILFLTVSLAFVISISFLFIYLRRKSQEAREVLRKLGQGDLKARFELKKFDEMGGLLVDFNQMADQIEHLVVRIRETEKARQNLLQELGHDLRTPLTSMRTATETLRRLDEKMSWGQRQEVYEIIENEIRYFGDLLEQLMLVASLDEPGFRSSREKCDILEILSREIRKRTNSGQLTWNLAADDSVPPVSGDNRLLQRLFNNALDNASRFGREHIHVKVQVKGGEVEVLIQDDGPGLSEDQIHDFGVRRRFLGRHLTQGLHASLGLGSVIMKSIAEMHGGRVAIQNRMDAGSAMGAELRICLPLSQD